MEANGSIHLQSDGWAKVLFKEGFIGILISLKVTAYKIYYQCRTTFRDLPWSGFTSSKFLLWKHGANSATRRLLKRGILSGATYKLFLIVYYLPYCW